MNTDDVLQALMNADEELREDIINALDNHPEELREALQELESPSDGDSAGDEHDEWHVITDESDDVEIADWEPDVDLSSAEEPLYSIISTVEAPRTAEEVRDVIQKERPEEVKTHKSLNNRGWISSKLNRLAKQGLVGKYRDGRVVRYTANIEKAVRNWARQNGVFIEELSREEHVSQIVLDTNMNEKAVRRTIKEMN